MEHESEGGEAVLQALEFDNKVRAEACVGFQQIRTIEHQLRIAPNGVLGRADGCEAQALRAVILSASATIVGSFSKIITLLSSPPNSNASMARNDSLSCLDRISGGAPAGGGGASQDQLRRAESPMSTAHTAFDNNTPPHSPQRLPAASSSRLTLIKSTSPAMSPCHTPHSGSGMSEGSPPNPNSSTANLDLDGEPATVGGQGRRAAAANEATGTSADPQFTAEQRALTRKRKFMPKYTCKQPASGTDPGNDGPPDDGHTWRKYGQKDILGSTYPRSYYRCTHKTEVGCPAIKYVQRSDEEPSMFDVTYRGNHTCQSMHQQQASAAWPFPFSPEQFALALTGAHHNSSPAMLNFRGHVGNHMSSPAHAAQTPVVTGPNDILLGPRSGFPPRTGGLAMSGVPPTSSILDNVNVMPSSQGMSPPGMTAGFGLSPPPMELDVHQQGFPTNPKVHNPSQQPVYDLSRSAGDSLFGINSNLMNMIMGGPRPTCSQGVSPSTLVEDPPNDTRGSSQVRQFEDQRHPGELAPGNTSNCGQMDKSPGTQYVERWAQAIESDNFQSLQPDAEDTYRYNNSAPISSGIGQSRGPSNNQTVSTERGHIVPVKDLDTSEQTSSSSFPMGFMDYPPVDSSVGVMDYEPYISNPFFRCA